MKKWLALALALVGCGPGLKEQVRLTSLAVRADAECQKTALLCPTAAPNAVALPQCKLATSTCKAALDCENDVKAGVQSIQSLQVARSTSGATPDLVSIARDDNAAALATCGNGGWK